MNILYLINYAGKGGSEKYVSSMAEYCLSRKDNVFLGYNEKGPLVENMASLGSVNFQLEMTSLYDIKASKKLAELCAENKIDIIHTQFARENYIALFAKKFFSCKAEIIHTCHINTENSFVWRILNKFFMNGNYKIIAVCNSVKALLTQNNYPAEKIQVIFNGVAFRDSIEKSSLINCEFGIDNGKFIFVSLARFSEEKGIFFLLEAAKMLKERYESFALVIAGDGDLYNKTTAYVKDNALENHVFLPGYRTDSDELLRSAHCFINSSSSEALSFAILEALETGLPVIASNVGGNPDIINKNTACGHLVEYNDVQALAGAMENMAKDKDGYMQLSQKARLAVKNIFNMDNSIKTTYNIYGESINNRRK